MVSTALGSRASTSRNSLRGGPSTTAASGGPSHIKSNNTKKIISKKGSAIFMHLTKGYKKTAGCIALKKKDFLILIKLINRKTKIRIN